MLTDEERSDVKPKGARFGKLMKSRKDKKADKKKKLESLKQELDVVSKNYSELRLWLMEI